MAGKDFWDQWEWAAWMKDPQLRRCQPATRGIWMDFLCVMMESGEYTLTGSTVELVRVTGNMPAEIEAAIADLESTQACDVTRNANGTVTLLSRRRQRKAKERIANKLRQRRCRGHTEVTEKSPSNFNCGSSGSFGRGAGEGLEEVTGDGQPFNGKQVNEWTIQALKCFEKHGPIPLTCTEAQQTRANCAELIALGKPREKFDLLCDWVTHSGNQFKPKDAGSMTDPAKWTKWQQSMEDEIERTNNKRGRYRERE